MRDKFLVSIGFFLVFSIGLFLFLSPPRIKAGSPNRIVSALANSISGIVFDHKRTALSEVPVELLNEYGQSIGRTRTDGGGRYFFTGMPAGRYQIRVIPIRYDYEEQVVEVEIYVLATKGATGTTSSSDSIMQDFYLRPRRGVLGLNSSNTSVVFAQDVPKPAQNAYERAVEDLANKKNAEGIASLEEAVKNFPTYFLALNRLGFEKFTQENYTAASEILARAADVNPRNIGTLYLLAYSLHLSNKNSAAVKILQYVLASNQTVSRISLLMGTILRINGQYQETEKHLLQAMKSDKENIADIHWQLALLYGKNLKRYGEAADELEVFLKLQPKSRDTENIKKLIKQFRDKAASK